jgi:NifU-like N terminal domain
VSVAVLSAIENEAETLMVDTIKTGTTLIEEGTLLPESLQCESEPWTSFYSAGGIIRELRKASGKQSKYGSDGNMAHSDKVIDHCNHLCNVGGLPEDDPNVGTRLVGAPECGDGAEFKTFGCGSAIASCSLATEWVKGKTSRKRWPSRTRISSVSSAFPCATLLDARRYSRIGGRLHLVGSPVFSWIIQGKPCCTSRSLSPP